MKIEILNRQKVKKINLNKLKKCIDKIFYILNISSKKISFVFCDNKFIKKINKKYFKRDIPTDVISFRLEDDYDKDYLGEIIISIEEAVLKSKIYNNTFEEEFLLYIIHGILHLLGYKDYKLKDRDVMEKKQIEVLKKVKELIE